MTTRRSGGKPNFCATSSGRTSTFSIASEGYERNSRKLPIRTPLIRNTGGPPLPRDEEVSGSNAATRSAMEFAPYAAISSELSSSTGASTVSTRPLRLSPVTTISTFPSSPACVVPMTASEPSCADAVTGHVTAITATEQRRYADFITWPLSAADRRTS